jgi:TadE-like protein
MKRFQLLSNSKRNSPLAEIERGAAVVEGALILPIFVALIFGIIEAGSMFLNMSSVRSASRNGARQASASASSAVADQDTLVAAGKSLSSLVGSLEGVIIFKASSINAKVPAECLAELAGGAPAPAGLFCNVYSPDKVRNPDITNFGAADQTETAFWDHKWPAQTRRDFLTATDNPDLIGVYVAVRHAGATGLLPKRTIRSLSVFQLEPQRSAE